MKKNNKACLIIFFMCTILFGCKEETNMGLKLQGFIIENPELQGVLNNACVKVQMLKNDEFVLVLDLKLRDSDPEFWITYLEKKNLNYYIFNANRRIVGYINVLNRDVVVLSTINSVTNFELTFYEFLKPTDYLKRFSYVYFPEHQYRINSHGIGYPPILRDYNFLIYKFSEKRFVKLDINPETKIE